MKILHTVESYIPAVGGMQEVVRQLSERLVAFGHDVTVATSFHPDRKDSLINGVKIETFSVSGNSVTGLEGDIEGYERFLLGSCFDVVVNFAAQQWATDIAMPLLTKINGRKVFIPTGFSRLYYNSYRSYYTLLPQFMRHYDMSIFHSDSYRDIQFARKHGIMKTVMIPNGAAADEFSGPVTDIRTQLDISQDHFLVLHVGSHSGLKGHDDAMEIFRRAEIKNSTLLLVGDEHLGGCVSLCKDHALRLNKSPRFMANDKRILVTQLSRLDTVSAYHAADIFLFPSNIECSPIVLFECLASHTPFLTTDVGNSAEIIHWSGGAGVLLPSRRPAFLPQYGNIFSRLSKKVKIVFGQADDYTTVRAKINGSAVLLETLYNDSSIRERMASSGFVAWKERFTWEIIAGQYENLYNELVTGYAG